jgi:hypothetical protein
MGERRRWRLKRLRPKVAVPTGNNAELNQRDWLTGAIAMDMDIAVDLAPTLSGNTGLILGPASFYVDTNFALHLGRIDVSKFSTDNAAISSGSGEYRASFRGNSSKINQELTATTTGTTHSVTWGTLVATDVTIIGITFDGDPGPITPPADWSVAYTGTCPDGVGYMVYRTGQTGTPTTSFTTTNSVNSALWAVAVEDLSLTDVQFGGAIERLAPGTTLTALNQSSATEGVSVIDLRSYHGFGVSGVFTSTTFAGGWDLDRCWLKNDSLKGTGSAQILSALNTYPTALVDWEFQNDLDETVWVWSAFVLAEKSGTDYVSCRFYEKTDGYWEPLAQTTVYGDWDPDIWENYNTALRSDYSDAERINNSWQLGGSNFIEDSEGGDTVAFYPPRSITTAEVRLDRGLAFCFDADTTTNISGTTWSDGGAPFITNSNVTLPASVTLPAEIRFQFLPSFDVDLESDNNFHLGDRYFLNVLWGGLAWEDSSGQVYWHPMSSLSSGIWVGGDDSLLPTEDVPYTWFDYITYQVAMDNDNVDLYYYVESGGQTLMHSVPMRAFTNYMSTRGGAIKVSHTSGNDDSEIGAVIRLDQYALTMGDCPGTSGNYFSVPNEAAFVPINSMEIEVTVSRDNSTGTDTIMSLSDTDDESWKFEVLASSQLRFSYWTGSTWSIATSSTWHSFSPGDLMRFRVVVDCTSPADVNFYESTDGVTWTTIGNEIVYGGTLYLPSVTSPLLIGAIGNTLPASTDGFDGKFFYTKLTVDEAVVFEADFTEETVSASSFTATTGQTVTVVGTADIIADTGINDDRRIVGSYDAGDVKGSALWLTPDAKLKVKMVGVSNTIEATDSTALTVSDGDAIAVKADVIGTTLTFSEEPAPSLPLVGEAPYSTTRTQAVSTLGGVDYGSMEQAFYAGGYPEGSEFIECLNGGVYSAWTTEVGGAGAIADVGVFGALDQGETVTHLPDFDTDYGGNVLTALGDATTVIHLSEMDLDMGTYLTVPADVKLVELYINGVIVGTYTTPSWTFTDAVIGGDNRFLE